MTHWLPIFAETISLHYRSLPSLHELHLRVEFKVYPKYDKIRKRVQINKEQYFSDVPDSVWSFIIGGYQPAQKWLKDRRGRQLSADDLQHHQRLLVALQRTGKLMIEIDETIPAWPIA